VWLWKLANSGRCLGLVSIEGQQLRIIRPAFPELRRNLAFFGVDDEMRVNASGQVIRQVRSGCFQNWSLCALATRTKLNFKSIFIDQIGFARRFLGRPECPFQRGKSRIR